MGWSSSPQKGNVPIIKITNKEANYTVLFAVELIIVDTLLDRRHVEKMVSYKNYESRKISSMI